MLWRNWLDATRISELPVDCRPLDRPDGYAVQRALSSLAGQPTVGWKIAATSLAGQAHIGVDGPIAGCLFADRVLNQDGGVLEVSLNGNHMRLAEAEFGFRLGRDLPKRDRAYEMDEVLDAVDALHPTIELPDTRYEAVGAVGAAQLIADAACAWLLIVGAAAPGAWRALDLARHTVAAFRNGGAAATGSGANVLGDPRIALVWLANELRVHGDGLRAGEIVTTGTCIAPVPLSPGDQFSADFGLVGVMEIRIAP